MTPMRTVDRSDPLSGAGATVCTACPMLCDDVAVGPATAIDSAMTVERACDHGRLAIAGVLARHAGRDRRPEATIDGRAVSRSEAIQAAAGLLAGGRRVLVTGLADATLSTQRQAAIVAERRGGGFDTGSRDGRLVTGSSIARAGEVTAQWEELRDRADLVMLWFADPSGSHPRFIERFLDPAVAGSPRTILALGPVRPSLPDGMSCEHLACEASLAVDLARSIEAEDDADPIAVRVRGYIESAKCTAIVTGAGDAIGIERWAVARLVRHLAHRGPAFEIPLGPGVLSGGGNAAGAAAVATWRHGASAAIAAACDRGGRFEPAEADGERLVARGEVDLLLVVGGLSESMRRAVAEATRSQVAHGHDVVWIGAEPERVVPGSRRTVFVRSAGTMLESQGQMLREDGRLVALRPLVAADAPSLEAVLGQFLDQLGGDAREAMP